MTWEAEFTTQWQTFLDTIETRIRREIKNNGSLNTEIINNIIQKEIDKWSSPSHYNGAWLQTLMEHKPVLASEFQATLQELEVSGMLTYNPRFPIRYIVIMLGVIIGAFLLLGWQDDSLIRQIIGTVFIAIFTFPICTNLYSHQEKKTVDNLVNSIQNKLNTTKHKLRNIVLKADAIK